MAGRLTVTVRQVLEDGSEAAADGELAAAPADSAEQFAGLLTWAAEESGFLDHGEREEAILREGRELEPRLLQATCHGQRMSTRKPIPRPSSGSAGLRETG